jgi:FkbM family methyltransferase
MSNRRIEILKNAALLRTLGGSPGDFLMNLLSPTCSVLGGRRIERVETAKDDNKAIFIKGVKNPLYFPAEFAIHGLHRVLTEETYSWNWHYYQIPQTRVERDDVIVDCGAAEGLFSLLAVERGARRVICIEPHPAYFRTLRRTFEDRDAVTVVNAAVGDAVGEIRLSDAGMDSVVTDQQDGTLPIQVETIDHLCFTRGIAPSFIKADIEGYEEKMLIGAAETISASRPKLAITTYHRSSAGEWMEKFLLTLYPKYKIYRKGLATQRGATVMLHAWN